MVWELSWELGIHVSPGWKKSPCWLGLWRARTVEVLMSGQSIWGKRMKTRSGGELRPSEPPGTICKRLCSWQREALPTSDDDLEWDNSGFMAATLPAGCTLAFIQGRLVSTRRWWLCGGNKNQLQFRSRRLFCTCWHWILNDRWSAWP